LVPGYFAVAESQKTWNPQWNRYQRATLWAAGIGSTFVPDLDVVYNALFRNFFNHSTLWTHSLLVYLALGLLWLVLHGTKRWPYLKTLAGLIAIGGASHLALDVIAHGTPLLYPLSMTIFGAAPQRVIDGGVWAYLTDPVFLLEPLLLGVAAIHWTYQQRILSPRQGRGARLVIIIGTILFMVAFILCIPILQEAVLPFLPA
jgi:hypothetical protein